MKTKFITSMILVFGLIFSMNGQDIPAKVKEALSSKYPNAKSVEWEKEGNNEYEAEFKIDRKEVSVVFDQNGQWLATEKEISKKMLPSAVIKSVKDNFVGYRIDEAEKIEMANGSIYYEVEIEKGKSEWEILLSADGTIKEKEKEDDEDEDVDD